MPIYLEHILAHAPTRRTKCVCTCVH